MAKRSAATRGTTATLEVPRTVSLTKPWVSSPNALAAAGTSGTVDLSGAGSEQADRLRAAAGRRSRPVIPSWCPGQNLPPTRALCARCVRQRRGPPKYLVQRLQGLMGREATPCAGWRPDAARWRRAKRPPSPCRRLVRRRPSTGNSAVSRSFAGVENSCLDTNQKN
jgi:hypothetical protein